MFVCGFHICPCCFLENNSFDRSVPYLPWLSCSNIHWLRSSTLAYMPPAAATRSLLYVGSCSILSPSESWGRARLAFFGNLELIGTECFIPKGSMISDCTKSTQLIPLTRATTSPATI